MFAGARVGSLALAAAGRRETGRMGWGGCGGFFRGGRVPLPASEVSFFWSEQDAGNDGEQREAGGREGRDEPSRDMVG